MKGVEKNGEINRELQAESSEKGEKKKRNSTRSTKGRTH